MMDFNIVYKLLNKHRDVIGKQAYKTLLGQVKSGNIEGAMKGYAKILARHNIDYKKAI